MQNLLALPAFDETGHLRAVVEIPAGTNRKFEYHKQLLEFQQDMRDGQPRVIDFLPYPVNYGFVAGTKMDKPRGGDGDPLDVLVLAESLPTGTVLPVLPIGLLKLQDGGEWDNKVLAVPADASKRIVRASNFREFQMEYSAARHILELFFMYYDGLGVMKVMGWGDENEAIAEVRKWQIV
ncbi:MAG: inorganic diphosphatase [Saprospiraceae bacterium]